MLARNVMVISVLIAMCSMHVGNATQSGFAAFSDHVLLISSDDMSNAFSFKGLTDKQRSHIMSYENELKQIARQAAYESHAQRMYLDKRIDTSNVRSRAQSKLKNSDIDMQDVKNTMLEGVGNLAVKAYDQALNTDEVVDNLNDLMPNYMKMSAKYARTSGVAKSNVRTFIIQQIKEAYDRLTDDAE